MAKITIGLGFMRTPAQEDKLRKAAAALPDDWTIEMFGEPGETRIWDVRVVRPSVSNLNRAYGPANVNDAIRMLEALNPKRT
jgi:hypothetical protein